jgi:hypothetical protein
MFASFRLCQVVRNGHCLLTFRLRSTLNQESQVKVKQVVACQDDFANSVAGCTQVIKNLGNEQVFFRRCRLSIISVSSSLPSTYRRQTRCQNAPIRLGLCRSFQGQARTTGGILTLSMLGRLIAGIVLNGLPTRQSRAGATISVFVFFFLSCQTNLTLPSGNLSVMRF